MSDSPQRAVVFAYHNVGVRGLSVLLSLGVEIPLVVTHRDNPAERIWFDSVVELANHQGIPTITPDDPNRAEVVERVRDCEPGWIFSFYYRHMLKEPLLTLPTRGAFNLHGSLLPKYRGRVPVNWAVLHGERETGASLHRMVLKPDAGSLVDQQAIAILPNDTAQQVFHKVTCAAETVLLRAVPPMMAGAHRERPLDLAAGSYFGGRRPEDGRVDWRQSAWQVHNLIRALAPPYPGAFTDIGGRRLHLLGSYCRGEAAREPGARLYWEAGQCHADCADRQRLLLTQISIDDQVLDEAGFIAQLGRASIPLTH